MKFESNLAWRDAVSAISANRDVLLPLAGVFFLLPAVAQSFFFSEIQTQILSTMGDQEAMQALVEEGMGGFMTFAFLAGLVQLVGYLAMLALLTDRARPTVGQALMDGLKSLPTLFGALLLFVVGYVVAMLLVAAVASALGSGAVSAILIVALVAVIFYAMIKFSLTMAVVVIERQLNPITALQRSWQLTEGNSFRLALFYFLLMIAYFVITLIVSILVVGLVSIADSGGRITMLAAGIVSGVVAAVAGVVMIAILSAIHRQLAGPSAEAVSETFE